MSATVRVAVPVQEMDILAGLIQSSGIARKEGFERVADSCGRQHEAVRRGSEEARSAVRSLREDRQPHVWECNLGHHACSTEHERVGTWSCEVVFTWTESDWTT